MAFFHIFNLHYLFNTGVGVPVLNGSDHLGQEDAAEGVFALAWGLPFSSWGGAIPHAIQHQCETTGEIVKFGLQRHHYATDDTLLNVTLPSDPKWKETLNQSLKGA